MTEESKPEQQEQQEQQEQVAIRPTFPERFQKVKAAWVAISAQLSEPEQFLGELRAAFPGWTLRHFTDGTEWEPETITEQDALIVTETGHPLPNGMVRKLFNARKQGLLIVRYVRKTQRIARFYGIYDVAKDDVREVWLCDRKMGLQQRQKMDDERAARAARQAAQDVRAQTNAAARAEKAAKAEAKAAARAAKKAAKEAAGQQAMAEGAPPPAPTTPKTTESAAQDRAPRTPQEAPKKAVKEIVKEAAPPAQAESDPASRRFSVRKLIVPPR